MNSQLYHSYHALSESGEKTLSGRYEDSPLMLELIRFLKHIGKPAFKNQDAVKAVYGEWSDKSEYAKKENRFFKLRKKLFDEIISLDQGDAEAVFPEEEQELLRCRKLINDNQKEGAYNSLVQLEKDCRRKNIFELLPSVLDQLIFINQSFNRVDHNTRLHKLQQEAIVLHHDNWQMLELSRKIYEIHFTQGAVAAQPEMKELEKLAEKHQDYPRFALCYHHIAMYYKLASANFRDEMPAIELHLKKFKELHALYAYMPQVTYRANYQQHQDFHFKQVMAFFHYNRFEFEEAYHIVYDIFKMATNEGSVCSIYASESVYYNLFQLEVATGRFSEAKKTVGLFTGFLKKNNLTDKIPQAYVMETILRCDVMQLKSLDTDFYLEKLETYIRLLKKNERIQIPYGEALFTKIKMYLLLHDFHKVAAIASKPEFRKYLSGMNITGIVDDFLLSVTKPQVIKKEELTAAIRQWQKNVTRPDAVMALKWCERFLNERKPVR